MRSRVQASCVLVAIVTLGGCKATSLVVPLQYRPTSMLNVSRFGGVLPGGPDTTLFVAPVIDDREVKDQIGENVEDPTPVPVFPTGPTAPEFFRDAVITHLQSAGLVTTAEEEKATHRLRFTLIRFWTRETNWYQSEVRARATIEDRAGKLLCDVLVAGANKRFGRSLSRENYQESLSDATLDFSGNLLASQEVQSALIPP